MYKKNANNINKQFAEFLFKKAGKRSKSILISKILQQKYRWQGIVIKRRIQKFAHRKYQNSNNPKE